MTNHPGRKPPGWLADAQSAADERIAATRWPDGDGAHVLTRADLQQTIRDAVVYGYHRGRLEAQTPDTAKGLRLIANGMPVRNAAALAGVAPSTLTRAKAKAGMPPGKPGRPPQR